MRNSEVLSLNLPFWAVVDKVSRYGAKEVIYSGVLGVLKEDEFIR